MKAFAIIMVTLMSASVCCAQTITRAEYFFDSDPGQGNANTLTFSGGTTVNETFSVSTASLSAGFHTINTRVRSTAGVWSKFASRTFFIIPTVQTNIAATQITKSEYFIDNDPGIGNAVPVSFTAGNPATFIINIPTNALGFGFHTVNVRVRDDQNRWSLFAQRTIYIVPPTSNVLATTISKAEYFFDSDPGRGNATPLPITAGNSQSNIFSLDVTSLQPGFHQVGIRYKDNLGTWSHFANRTFWIIDGESIAPLAITKLEYFIDANPELDATLNGKGIAVTPAANVNTNLFIDLGDVLPGDHTLYVRARDDKGFWSTIERSGFTILSCTTPTPPVAADVSRCGEGVVTLSASGASVNQVYRWYESNTSSNSVHTGESFTTPNVTATRAFYVSIYDPATTCESGRTEVFGQVNLQDKPAISPSGDVSLCEGGSVILSAPAGFTNYIWSTGETTRQILVNATGQYSIRVGDGTCVSPSSDEVSVNVESGPAKPAVSVTGNPIICENGSVTLTAPSGFNYLWSNGATTQAITVSQTGAYALQVSSGSGCLSAPSNAIGVIVQSQPCGNVNLCATLIAPEVFDVSRCGPGTLTLSASGASGTETYRWYENAADITPLAEGQQFTTPALTTSREFFVSIYNPAGSCESPRTMVRALVNFATKPEIITAGNPAICQGNSIVLTAPSGFSQYVWSGGETTRQISVSASGEYAVQVGDRSCVSPPSDPVAVVVNALPAKPSLTVTGNTTICGSGSVTLTAPAGFNYRWSTAATTQSITASQTGVYFVRIISAEGCESVPSDPVAITVQTPPCSNGIENQSPVIDDTPVSTPIEGKVQVDLTAIVTDADENLDYTTLRLVSIVTARGASAQIDGAYNLLIDYAGIPFSGVDRVTIEVCDLAGACVQQVIDIEVAGAVVVYNGITPDGDGKNDFLLLKYIDVVESAAENRVFIFNRWGDIVFETSNYNNKDRVFNGTHKNGSDLTSGTYYYRVEFSGGLKTLTGFLTIKR